MAPFPAHLGATTKTMRFGPGVTRVGTFRSADEVLVDRKKAGRDTGENGRSPLQLAELLLLQKLPQHRSLFLALSFGTFHIRLLPGAGVSLLGLILDRDFNGCVRPHWSKGRHIAFYSFYYFILLAVDMILSQVSFLGPKNMNSL